MYEDEPEEEPEEEPEYEPLFLFIVASACATSSDVITLLTELCRFELSVGFLLPDDEPEEPFELDEEPEEEPLFSALPIAPAIALPRIPPMSPKFAIEYTPFVHNKSRNFRPCFCI